MSKEIIEETLYSNSFKFFLEHQIFVITTKLGMIKYASRLDGRLFFSSVKKHDVEIDEADMRLKCKSIHKNLNYYGK